MIRKYLLPLVALGLLFWYEGGHLAAGAFVLSLFIALVASFALLVKLYRISMASAMWLVFAMLVLDSLVEKAIEVMASGMPQPAIFNDKVNVVRLVNMGCSLEDARSYSINNCMVPTIPGKNLNHMSAWGSGVRISNGAVNMLPDGRALTPIATVARERGNIFAELMETVKSGSLGQISSALYVVGGEYRRNM